MKWYLIASLCISLYVAGLYADSPNVTTAPASSLLEALQAANPDYQYNPATLSVDEKKGIIKIRSCGKSFTNIQPLAEVDFCTDLTVHGCGVDSLDPIRKFKLTRLDLGDCGVADLAPLRGMPITELTLYNTRVKSLEPLRGMPLRSLKTNVVAPSSSFYEIVGELKTLENLEFAYCYLDPEQLKKLQPTLKSMLLGSINFTGKKPVDLNSFREQPFTSLTLIGTAVTDWNALSNFHNLKSLTLKDASFDNTQPLNGLPVETLIINNTKPRPLTITGLQSLPLKQLTLKNCVVDLKPLAGSPVQEITFTPACVSGGFEALRECRALTSIIVFIPRPDGKEDQKTYTGAKAAKDFLRDLTDGKIKGGSQP